MNCEDVQKKIVLFNELLEEEKREVWEHLKVCESCRRFFEEEQKLRELLKSVRVEKKVEKLSWRRIAITAAAVMAILLSVILMTPKNVPREVIYFQQKGAIVEIFIDGGVK